MGYNIINCMVYRYFQEGLPELACAIILRDVLLALQYLHKQFYIHRLVISERVIYIHH